MMRDFTDWIFLCSATYWNIAMVVSFIRHPYVPPTYIALCGHKTTVKGWTFIDGYGRKKVKLQFREDQPICCLECFGTASVICAECARPIVPGNPIRLVRLTETSFLFLGAAVQYRLGRNRSWKTMKLPAGKISEEMSERIFHHGGEAMLVCCCRKDCAPHRFIDGMWMYPGRVISVREAIRRGLIQITWIGRLVSWICSGTSICFSRCFVAISGIFTLVMKRVRT